MAISAWAQSNGVPRLPAVGEVMRALPKDAPPIAAILAIQRQEPAGPRRHSLLAAPDSAFGAVT
jgi:hypothetical protein